MADFSWIPKALMTLMELSQFNKNWDSYEADPVSPEALGYAVQLLGTWADPHWNVPEPRIVPCSSGSIQFEWNEPNLEFELAPLDEEGVVAHYLFCHDDDSDKWEEETSPTLADLCERLAEIPGWLSE